MVDNGVETKFKSKRIKFRWCNGALIRPCYLYGECWLAELIKLINVKTNAFLTFWHLFLTVVVTVINWIEFNLVLEAKLGFENGPKCDSQAVFGLSTRLIIFSFIFSWTFAVGKIFLHTSTCPWRNYPLQWWQHIHVCHIYAKTNWSVNTASTISEFVPDMLVHKRLKRNKSL